MNPSPTFEDALRAARQLYSAGQFGAAEKAYRDLAQSGEQRETVLRELLDVLLRTQQAEPAVDTLRALIETAPERFAYHAQLAGVLDALGRTGAAIEHYRDLLARRPDLAPAHFNLALLSRKSLRHADAIASYRRAIELGIDNVAEAWSNLGVVYSELRDTTNARACYEAALAADPTYSPALFNLAGLQEELGEREQACQLYRHVLTREPGHWEALARIAGATRVTDRNDGLVAELQRGIAQTGGDPAAQESLYFALGKVHDGLGQYADAFAAYGAANRLGKRRHPGYDPLAAEQAFEQLMQVFDGPWPEQAAAPGDASPVFIVGMFRSGSTLLERMLAAHPAIIAGGELDILPWLVARHLAPYPQSVIRANAGTLTDLREEYLARRDALFPGAAHVTDKRPDNFLHLGLIRVLFPAARIVYTRRERRDNVLSVFFQQFGSALRYATDLSACAHYYDQHVRLMRHWTASFGDNIHCVDYDETVRAPEPVVRGLLSFLGLDWDQRCLDFQRSAGPVKTASVWQVREPLHTASSGRWRNYREFLPATLTNS